MESVNCHYLYTDRIEHLLILQEIHRNNRITLLRGNLYGRRTAALVNRYTAVRLLEPDNLFSWDGIAVRAATESRFLQLGKVALQEALGLVSNNNVIPLHERNNTFAW